MKGKVKGAAAVRRWFALGQSALEEHRGQLNQLNVFPVPDSDTGANMLATVRTCRRAADDVDTDDLGEMLARAGAEAMAEASGNSGTLLAVLISGFAEPLHGTQRLTVETLSRGLQRASLRAWSALSQPVEGTMLSVLNAVRDQASALAASAAELESRAALEQSLPELVAVARDAVTRTEQQLPVLREAKVVDSGAAGMLLILDALRATVRGETPDPHVLDGLPGCSDGDRPHSPAPPAGDPDAVELMCTALLDPLGAASLRHRIDELGESVIITPIGPVGEAAEEASAPAGGAAGAGHAEQIYRWRIHVHTAQAEAALQAVRSAGELESSTVTPLTGGD